MTSDGGKSTDGSGSNDSDGRDGNATATSNGDGSGGAGTLTSTSTPPPSLSQQSVPYYQRELAHTLALLDRAVTTRETRVIARALRVVSALRRRWNGRQYVLEQWQRRERERSEAAVELLPEDVERERAEAQEREAKRNQRTTLDAAGGGAASAADSASGSSATDASRPDTGKAVTDPSNRAGGTESSPPSSSTPTPTPATTTTTTTTTTPPAPDEPVAAAREAHGALKWAVQRVLSSDSAAATGLCADLDAALHGAVATSMEVVTAVSSSSSSPANAHDTHSSDAAVGGVADAKASSLSLSSSSSPSPPPLTLSASAPPQPELRAFLHLLVLLYVIDAQLDDASRATECADRLIAFIQSCGRRHTLDEIGARAFYATTLAYEVAGRLSDCRPMLFAAHRTAVLRHDHVGQAVLLNQLLRSFLLERQYAQADQLCSRAAFPESRSNNQLARYFYYMGRIKAVQLDYTEAYRCLSQAQRKAPQQTALGFRLAVVRLMVLVQLLMGEVPQLSTFRGGGGGSSGSSGSSSGMHTAASAAALAPYMQLTRAVHLGDLHAFHAAVAQHNDTFAADDTLTLIARLRHNVIKAGLVKIAAAYSRISLEDVRQRLGLESVDDTESVVAKAVRDGVIRAVIDHTHGVMRTMQELDTYSTSEPMMAFHERVQFCMDLRDEAVRAMRFPDTRKNQENLELLREMQRGDVKIEQALAEGTDDEDEDGDDADGGAEFE